MSMNLCMFGLWPSPEAEVPRNMREAVLLTIPIWLVVASDRNPLRKPTLMTVHCWICRHKSLFTTKTSGNILKIGGGWGTKWNKIERPQRNPPLLINTHQVAASVVIVAVLTMMMMMMQEGMITTACVHTSSLQIL